MRSRKLISAGISLLMPILTVGAQAQPLPDRLPLVGELKDETGQPLAGAYISIRRQDDTGQYAFWGSEATTDEKGRFRFPTAEEGRYYLNADKADYAQRMNQVIDWKKGLPPLQVTMPRLATPKLRLLKPDGSPLRSSPFFLRYRGDGEAGQSYIRSATDADGVVPTPKLIPANYKFIALVSGIGSASIDVPNVVYAADPQILDLSLKPGGTLKLKVVEKGEGGAEKPLGGASLLLNLNAPANPVPGQKNFAELGDSVALLAAGLDRSALSSEEGSGEITLKDLPVGTYSAFLMPQGIPRTPSKDLSIREGQTTEMNWDFPAKPQATLTIQVKGRGDAPWVSQDVWVRMQPMNRAEPVTPDFIPGLGGNFPTSNARRGKTDAEGKISLYPVIPGKYRIWVQAKEREGRPRPGAASLEIEVPLTGASVSFTLPNAVPAP